MFLLDAFITGLSHQLSNFSEEGFDNVSSQVSSLQLLYYLTETVRHTCSIQKKVDVNNNKLDLCVTTPMR